MSGDDYLISTLTVFSITCSFSHHFYFVVPILIGNDNKQYRCAIVLENKAQYIFPYGSLGTCVVHWLWVCSAHNSTTVACLAIFLCSFLHVWPPYFCFVPTTVKCQSCTAVNTCGLSFLGMTIREPLSINFPTEHSSGSI